MDGGTIALILVTIVVFGVMIWAFISWRRMPPEEREKASKEFEQKYYERMEQKNAKVNEQGQVVCPRCGSTQIQMVNKRWSVTTGLLTNKVDRVCVRCKTKF